jgi:hypothetical protein
VRDQDDVDRARSHGRVGKGLDRRRIEKRRLHQRDRPRAALFEIGGDPADLLGVARHQHEVGASRGPQPAALLGDARCRSDDDDPHSASFQRLSRFGDYRPSCYALRA